MKGTVYGGVVYFPVHPKADMHGLVRIIVRTKSVAAVMLALASFNITVIPQFFNYRVWAESKSAIEENVTFNHYGEVFVCAVNEAYLSAERYSRIPKGMRNV